MKEVNKKQIELTINGQKHKLFIGGEEGEIPESETLVHTLRNFFGLTGTKIGCDEGACGACTVILDGEAVASCMIFTAECDGRSVLTIEGLENPATGELDRIQQAFIDHTAFQCGFCTPGIIMAAKALFDKNPCPSEEEIAEALAGNYCRCGSHHQVIDTLVKLAKKGGERHGSR